MNLVNRNRQEPLKAGVYMITGVNGIGKSTLVDQIASGYPEAIPMHASRELGLLFGGISREEMEELKPEDKLAKMVVYFTAQFDKFIDDSSPVILDTHLLVPIRRNNSVVYEDIWSNAYVPYTNSVVMLTADPSDIRAWRLRDEATTGRHRNTDIAGIHSDQQQNVARFESLMQLGSLPQTSEIIHNNNGLTTMTRMAIENNFRVASEADPTN